MKILSPRRKSTNATDADSLVSEQLAHFGIDATSDFGKTLARITSHLYHTQVDLNQLWTLTLDSIQKLDRSDRIAYFNAKKFLSFQLAKLLDTLQNPSRASYQSLSYSPGTVAAKGPYSPFDNVAALFSATPVITRTATYIYACAEWIEDAFQGKELLLEIYSRLLNPTSVSLANAIVDIECGPYAADYFAWNFSSGMAAIDATLSHVLGRDDIVIHSRNIYGGAFQLIHDWYAKPGNLDVAVETFAGNDATSFIEAYDRATKKYADRIRQGRKIYCYIESPANPHGTILDVPAICKAAHERGIRVMLDATVATPFLMRSLQHKDEASRPDFVIHAYTKDISGTGSVIAGCVIARNHDMFLPKGVTVDGHSWDQTMFWNVYYVKGAFLSADAAFEVLQGSHTMEMRMLAKCINTLVLAQFLESHDQVSVTCAGLKSDPNYPQCQSQHFLGLPAPLFTADFGKLPREAFMRFFDNLAPTFAHMISLGQSNTIVSCPALTTHSELSETAQRAAGISPTMVRIAVGDEDPLDLIDHLIQTAKFTIDPDVPGFSDKFPDREKSAAMIREIYLDVHKRFIEARTTSR
jgi:O-acetylhomoserine/O-acetylserine sulfhydrylase-like pyridoxal-dependent enzyme